MRKIYVCLFTTFLGLLFVLTHFNKPLSIDKPAKIVGLVAVRNEESFIKNCLKALSVYADAIVVLDDASEDKTLSIVQSLKNECHIEHIIAKKEWARNERGDKNALLQAGRAIGGTHFILMDADEMFTAQCAKNNWLRNKILALVPGQMMEFPMMNLWESIHFYRNDAQCNPHDDKWNCIPAVLCDDGSCNYDDNRCWGPSGTMHVPRQPVNRKCTSFSKVIRIHEVNYGLLHFKSVNLEEIASRKVWYMCLEFIKSGSAQMVNTFYEREFKGMLDTSNIHLESVPDQWLDYPELDLTVYADVYSRKRHDIATWLAQYGVDYFRPLHIWDQSWMQELGKQHQTLS
jgi:glycosyltransferase involved in cell wall biosynthesis